MIKLHIERFVLGKDYLVAIKGFTKLNGITQTESNDTKITTILDYKFAEALGIKLDVLHRLAQKHYGFRSSIDRSSVIWFTKKGALGFKKELQPYLIAAVLSGRLQ